MNKKFKPFTLFLYLIVIFFMIWGSNLVRDRMDEDIRKNQGVEKEWEGVITLWDFPGAHPGEGGGFRWIRDRIREFERKHPGVFIQLHGLDWEEGNIQLDLAVQSGTYPDIAPVGTNFEYSGRGVLEPLDEYFSSGEAEFYLDYALKAVSHRDRIWGIPLYGTAPILLINTEIFAKRGVAPPEGGRWTYGEFVEALKKLTYDENGDGEMDVYGFNSFILNGHSELGGILLSDGWRLYDDALGEYAVFTPEALSGLKKLTDLVSEYKVVPDDFGTCSPARVWEDFSLVKRTAVCPAGLWAVNRMKALRDEGKGFEFGIVEYPIGSMGRPVTVGDVAAYGIFRQNDERKKKMCIEFVHFIVKALDEQEMGKRGVLPVRRDKAGQRGFLVEPGHIETVPKMNRWHYIEDILYGHIRQAVLGREEPEEALRAAQREIDIIQRQK